MINYKGLQYKLISMVLSLTSLLLMFLINMPQHITGMHIAPMTQGSLEPLWHECGK